MTCSAGRPLWDRMKGNRNAFPLAKRARRPCTMEICKACYKPLPAPAQKGHRSRKFCNAACKQRFYRKHRSERKRWEHTPFWKEQADFWQKQAEQQSRDLERERQYGDRLEEALHVSQGQYERLRERQEWLEARLS